MAALGGLAMWSSFIPDDNFGGRRGTRTPDLTDVNRVGGETGSRATWVCGWDGCVRWAVAICVCYGGWAETAGRAGAGGLPDDNFDNRDARGVHLCDLSLWFRFCFGE